MTNHLQPWARIAKQLCRVGIPILVLAGLCMSQSPNTPSPSDWPQFHRDNMQRSNPYETVLNVNNVGNLQLKWSFITGRTQDSSHVVANGVVYVGSRDDHVYALNASTGATLWSFATGWWVLSAPAVANGVVYVGSVDGNLYALNASTGAMLWSFAAVNAYGGLYSSPAVVNGVVYVGSTETPSGSGWAGHVYALDGSTGAMLWTFAAGEAPGWPAVPNVAVANGVVYAGSGDGNLYALNASTGAKLWSYATGGRVQAPAAANGVVYVGSSDHNVYALNASTGAKLWSYATGGFVETSPAVANGVVYVGSDDHNVYALNASTGAKLWSYATGAPVPSSPAVANGVVYVGSNDHHLYALNASTGAKLWSYTTAGAAVYSPVVVDGVVSVDSWDNNGNDSGNGIVYAFGLPAGADLQLQAIAPNPVPSHHLYNYTFSITNNGTVASDWPRLVAHVPYGVTFHSYKFSPAGTGYCVPPAVGTRGDVTCRYQGTQPVGTTWTVTLTVWAWSPPGTIITQTAATMAGTHDPKWSNNTVTITTEVQ